MSGLGTADPCTSEKSLTFDFSAVLRINCHTSPADDNNCPDDNGDSHPKQYAATSHRNIFTDNHTHACAEI